ncbi:uncharacterized protein TRAVEDRAFT_48151 [Trametes versicolor FP-101664 SS1]|uniref:uncharacterized protein n=1 Tax=Trametes versicolor (strain FP-101664) TaxID=717944 RepID=UPI0004623F99|nr:uncharacterized protein TRAVEDRAFT_48151 [Trametes versicolor FP-101664 SS1]EIW59024.1 hypothetical protein TRAVEDRAFT_48151 [Trametes versicolor FP-101664 SS1]
MQSQATQADADAGATQTLDSREAVEPKQSDAVSDLLAVEGEADLLGALEGKPTAATPQTAAEAVPRPDGVEDGAKLSPEGSQPVSHDANNFYATESTPCAVDQPSQDAVEDTHDDELARIRSLVSQAMDLCSKAIEGIEQLRATSPRPHMLRPPPSPAGASSSPSPFMLMLGYRSPAISTLDDQGTDVGQNDYTRVLPPLAGLSSTFSRRTPSPVTPPMLVARVEGDLDTLASDDA